ncbi:MAG: alcohol dehydrogenase catalytic domain-containing protein [Phycisphaerales bacterium]|nr:alcohol dehydrogenase catalytic domain-containing protein [Phycisphaerales bacterium]MCB9856248.1 alcohol dehydrogenase catalytic domain-containing protein [Phycisphaerales bacterium]MCB9863313.1 alcohol dehydrogenase catalytic domain-containing protein [Phycisphaerales bacterium]
MRAVTYDISAWRWIACKLLSRITPRIYLSPISSLRMRDVPEPNLPGPDWVRLKTIYGGVCGTDLGLITSKGHPNTILQQYAAFPAVLGHENVAIIAEVGENVRDFNPGDRVCADPAIGCRGRQITPVCRYCNAGLDSLCEGMPSATGCSSPSASPPSATGCSSPSASPQGAMPTPKVGMPHGATECLPPSASGDPRHPDLPPRALLGLNRLTLGSWAPQFLAHVSQLHRVPDDITNEQAILVDPIASATHAVLRRRPEPGEHVLVQGAGIVALGVIAAIRALECDNPITILVRNKAQADLARTMGATTTILTPRNQHRRDKYIAIEKDTNACRVEGRMGNQSLIGGYDLTYDCAGTGRALSDALSVTRSRGVCVLVGTTGIAMTDTTCIWFNEVDVIGASGRQIESIDGQRKHTYDVVFDWLTSGKLDLSPLPTACVPLSDYRRGLAMLINRPRKNIVKLYFRPGE